MIYMKNFKATTERRFHMFITMQTLLKQYTEAVHKIYGRHLKTVALYGSYVRGDNTEESDIDIKPIAKNREHFSKWVEVYPFYSNVKKEGVTLFDVA